MLSRLMDLVVLVAELTRDSDKSYKDLDKELATRGYSPEEIEQAVFLYSSRGELPHEEKTWRRGANSVRVLSDWERLSLCSECYGYLLRLLNLGIIDCEHSLFHFVIHSPTPSADRNLVTSLNPP